MLWFSGMNDFSVIATSQVTSDDLPSAKLGNRFGRLDSMSQLALLAVEALGVNFEPLARDRIAICLATRAGCISTDIEFWKGRDVPGGPSPTLFTYTLPSSAIGEIAIRHRITGPNLCLIGDDELLLNEAAELIRAGEVDACVCVSCDSATAEAGQMIGMEPVASARALFLQRCGEGLRASSAPQFLAC